LVGFGFDVACYGADLGVDETSVFGKGDACVGVVNRGYEAIVDWHFSMERRGVRWDVMSEIAICGGRVFKFRRAGAS